MKNNILIPKSYDERSHHRIVDFLVDDTYFHDNTRWHNTFKTLSREQQLKIIEQIVDIQFQWINDCIIKKVAPIELEGLGKFLIRPGRADFLNLVADEEYDKNYEKIKAEVLRRRYERIAQRRFNTKSKTNPIKIKEIKWN